MTLAAPFRGWSIDPDVDARTTLGRMARMVRKSLTDPVVVHTANRVIAVAHVRDLPGQVAAIGDFMDRNFRFVSNPVDAQAIRPPRFMLDDLQARGFTQGACDDAAVLVASLGMANGIPARFRAVAFCHRVADTCDPTVPYSHVIADLYDGTDWHALDVTRPYDMDRPSEVARTLTAVV